MEVHADVEACQGYVTCVMSAPEVFDLDDAEGTVVVLQTRPGKELHAKTLAAVQSCPARALSVSER
jgi:ferredoxin